MAKKVAETIANQPEEVLFRINLLFHYCTTHAEGVYLRFQFSLIIYLGIFIICLLL